MMLILLTRSVVFENIWKIKKVLTVQGRLDTATGGMEGKLALKKKVS